MVDGQTYSSAFGRNKKEAKEEAAKLAYQEICSNLPSRVSINLLCEITQLTHCWRRGEGDSKCVFYRYVLVKYFFVL